MSYSEAMNHISKRLYDASKLAEQTSLGLNEKHIHGLQEAIEALKQFGAIIGDATRVSKTLPLRNRMSSDIRNQIIEIMKHVLGLFDKLDSPINQEADKTFMDISKGLDKAAKIFEEESYRQNENQS